MSVTFDKKLAELDAYLQMLISENESLDKKLDAFARASNATINNYEAEIEGIINIKNNLEKLLSSIKHAIVLLQIAKVSSRASFSSTAGELCPPQSTPSPPTRPVRSSKLISSSLKESAASEPIRNKSAADCRRRQGVEGSLLSSSSSSSANTRSIKLSSTSSTAATEAGAASAPASKTAPVAKLQQDTLAHQTPSKPQLPQQSVSQLHDTPVLSCSSAASSSSSSYSSRGVAEILRRGREIPSRFINVSIRDDEIAKRSSCSPSVTKTDDEDEDDNDNDDDDDDAFFDAADDQHNQSKSTPNLDPTSNINKQARAELSSNSTKQSLPTNDTLISDPLTLLNNTITTKQNTSEHNPRSAMSPPPTQSAQDTMGEANNNIDNNTITDETIDWDQLYEEEEEDELGSLEGQGSVIKHLLSQIRIGMDLTKVVLPTFILERRSLLEMYADFFAHPDLFSTIPDYATPEERITQLVRWYLSAFHAGRKSSLAKKPYNPILGEIFKCQWTLDNKESEQANNNKNEKPRGNNQKNIQEQQTNKDDTVDEEKQQLTFVAEQVSHHPPVSAFYAVNKEKSISCCAHIYTKSKYLGLSVGVHNIGQGTINLLKHNETYVCTFPSAYGRSILTVPWVELGGPVTIACEQTGFKANIEFVMKPFYGGKKHRVMGEILRPNNEVILTIDGEWNGIMHSKTSNSSEKQIFVDTTNLPVIKKHVEPVSTQESFESRNVWKEVTRALKMKDVTSATAAKSFIEQRQRDLLKDRLEKGIKWETRYFEAADDGWRYSSHLESPGDDDQKS